MHTFNALCPEQSKVWIHQCNRFFTDLEAQSIENELSTFLNKWTAHQQQLHAQCVLLHQCFIVILLNEQNTQASGCSIDALTHFLKQVEQKYAIQLFNRELFAFKNPHTLETVIATKKEMETFIQQGIVNDNTLIFNNLINTCQQLKNEWQIPFKHSWHKNFFS